MSLIINFLIVILSAVVILVSAEYAVKNVVMLAKRYRLSDELIGMTILSIGTTLPEIITHVVGSIKIIVNPSVIDSVSALVIGTNIGSDIFQQDLILPLIALMGVVVVEKKHLLKDVGGLIIASVLMLLFSLNGIISRFEGAVLFFGYIAYLILLEKKGMITDGKEYNHKAKHIGKQVIIVIICFILMAYAADHMLGNSITIAESMDISDSFFGVLLLGVVAAFPELMTAIVAVFKKKEKVSIGVLVGSNITNPMFALGLGAMMSSYTVPSVVVLFDLPIKIITAGLILWFLWDKRIMKGEAVLLMLLYVLYIIARKVYFPVDILL